MKSRIFNNVEFHLTLAPEGLGGGSWFKFQIVYIFDILFQMFTSSIHFTAEQKKREIKNEKNASMKTLARGEKALPNVKKTLAKM